ncbi:hypothetical protein [Methylosinus sp. C49]|uniref:hypothetical protein n=1 Tax=Methylosinus sp. C49 TaxID=2699395 RepID=UPI00137945B8|nr:hypothetical protein [Methylosinus sp. C49]
MIAGLLAWALILPGIAAAAWSAVDHGIVATSLGHCAAPGDADDNRHSPGSHFSCSCCIPCRTSQLDGPAGAVSALPQGLCFSFPAHVIAASDVFQIVEKSSPAGWISSWSSRAPPTR